MPDNNWNTPYQEAVGEGVTTKKGIAGEQPTKRLGGTLGTAQGGDGPSPNGANIGSLSQPANSHGTVLANGDPFITSIGISDLPDVTVNGGTLDGTSITESALYSQDATESGTSAAIQLTAAFAEAGEQDFALSFSNVYSGNTTASATYYSTTSTSGIAAGGSGWYIDGTNLFFTNGSLDDFAAAVASGTCPASGATIYPAYTFTYTQVRGVQPGQVGVLSVGDDQKDVRAGDGGFGTSRLGSQEVTIIDQPGGGEIDMPTSQNIGISQSIRNVGSRFNR